MNNMMDLNSWCHSRESGNPLIRHCEEGYRPDLAIQISGSWIGTPPTGVCDDAEELSLHLSGDDSAGLKKIHIFNLSGYNKENSFSFKSKSEALGERHA